MVKRVSIRPYIYVAFAMIVMLACWESNKTQAAVVDRTIPEESIRLRILANSDTAQDQWIKRQVRDEIVAEMAGWVSEPQGIEAARTQVREHIPQIERLVAEVLQRNGYDYTYHVELGQVPFPTKMYGDKVYPAGNYEALRVTLGKGEGQNWWCVLFPPLCFIDGKSGDAVAKKKTADQPDQVGGSVNAKKLSASAEPGPNTDAAPQAEVKFFLWELLKQIFSLLKGIFG
jgi:stage II sporulation protein R